MSGQQEGATLEHGCDKGRLFDILTEGQGKIFDKLDDLSDTLRSVAVQKNELQHLRKDVDELKHVCEKRHARGETPLFTKIKEAVLITVSVGATVFVLGLFTYIGFVNINDYLAFRNNPTTATEGKHK